MHYIQYSKQHLIFNSFSNDHSHKICAFYCPAHRVVFSIAVSVVISGCLPWVYIVRPPVGVYVKPELLLRCASLLNYYYVH